jgi:hypothetical protein
VVVLEEKEVHLVKRVSKELGLTYRELGEEIGYSEGALRGAVSKNQLSGQLKKALELYLEVEKLKESKKEIKKSKELLETFMMEIKIIAEKKV